MKRCILLFFFLVLLSSCGSKALQGQECKETIDCKGDLICTSGTCQTTPSPRPLAVAGSNQSVGVGDTVRLDGSQSTSLTGRKLSYLWSLKVPTGSKTKLKQTNQSKTSFLPDVAGEYKVELVVQDGFVSKPSTVTILAQVIQHPPIAKTGPDRTVLLGKEVLLDASASSDRDGDPLTYQWKVQQQPSNSKVKLDNPRAPQTAFVPTQAGLYILSLEVSDGENKASTNLLLKVVKKAPLPTLVNASRTKLPIKTRSRLQLKGTGFLAGVRVFLGELEASQVQLQSDTELQVTFDLNRSNIGERDLYVLNPDGQRSAPLKVSLFQAPAPLWKELRPSWIFVQQTVVLELRGEGLLPGVQLVTGNRSFATEWKSSTLASTFFRAETTGKVALYLQNPDGLRSPPLSLEVVGIAALPTKITPAQVLMDASRVVRFSVEGFNFVKGARLRLSSEGRTILANNPIVVTSNRLTAELPLKGLSPSRWKVEVVNPASQAGNSITFEILAP